MLVFPAQLVLAAKNAGMKLPPDPNGDYDRDEFYHFDMFCRLQLRRPLIWGEHWDNAKIIARTPRDELEKMTLRDLINKGFSY